MSARAKKGSAPTLRLFVDDPGLIGPEHTDAMVREARALLAVAKAVEACRADPDWVNMIEVDEYAALDRAADRLARASRGET